MDQGGAVGKNDATGWVSTTDLDFSTFNMSFSIIDVLYRGIFNLEDNWRLVVVLKLAFVSIFAILSIYCCFIPQASQKRGYFSSASIHVVLEFIFGSNVEDVFNYVFCTPFS